MQAQAQADQAHKPLGAGPLSELLESASHQDVEAALDTLLRSKFNKERERLRGALSLQHL